MNVLSIKKKKSFISVQKKKVVILSQWFWAGEILSPKGILGMSRDIPVVTILHMSFTIVP